MVVDPGDECRITHDHMPNFPSYLESGSVIVFNDTRVRKARLIATSTTGGKVELLLLEQLSRESWRVLTSKTRKQRKGKRLLLPDGVTGEIVEERDRFRIISFSPPIDEPYLEKHGIVPLPPYIKRESTKVDEHRYQTVFSEKIGSVAAPTAGLHFTDAILDEISRQNITICYITLEVGIGTFLPLRTENVEEHRMHSECYSIGEFTAKTVTDAKREGRKIVAVGTTTVRTLESAWNGTTLPAGKGSTDLYIYPGYSFSVVDQLFTNFHTSQSSLLVMVSAFAGKECIEKAYQAAIDNEYRFFSYGDAMFITSTGAT
jgi:S-adenosylmethionine:tRNA ribosyltransferase-isomerase